MLLAEQVIALGLGPAADQRPSEVGPVRNAAAAAILAELALMGRIDVVNPQDRAQDQRIEVRFGGSTGSELLDALAADVASAADTRPYLMIHAKREVLWARLLDNLVRQRVLPSAEPAHLTVAPEYHWSPEYAARFAGTRSELDTVLVRGGQASAGTGVLIGILDAAKLVQPVMAPPDRATKKAIRKHLKQLKRQLPPSPALPLITVSIVAATLAEKMDLSVSDG